LIQITADGTEIRGFIRAPIYALPRLWVCSEVLKTAKLGPVNSLIIPVYKNAESLQQLLLEIDDIAAKLSDPLEVVFVIDGSPDVSYAILRRLLPDRYLFCQLICLSRNFGSFAAIRAGLARANGRNFAVMAADLQDPPETIIEFFNVLATEPVDIVVGARATRGDPRLTRFFSNTYWFVYRKFIVPDLPPGGIDIFGCNALVRDALCRLPEVGSSLIGLLFWLGFRRKVIVYHRRLRPFGKSAWSFGRKLRYMFDSMYSFTDFPINALMWTGALGVIASGISGTIVFLYWALGRVDVPGYTSIVLLVIFFGTLNTLSLGIVGAYLWRTFENTKGRPQSIVISEESFGRSA
jgi:glycosyltransferase involved in cell wall biosynthesis